MSFERPEYWEDQYISKLQAWDLFKYMQENVGGISSYAEMFFEKELGEMQKSPVRLEQHGTWYYDSGGYPYCSICGKYQLSGESADEQDYCDYCGAKMDGQEEFWPKLKSKYLGGNSK